MSSIRARILIPTLALVVAGGLLVAGLTLWGSQQRIGSVYDAQLIQGARLLQGMLPLQDQEGFDWQLFSSELDAALNYAEKGLARHPYEVHLEFQIWADDGRLLVSSAEAPQLDIPLESGIQSFILDTQEWRGALLEASTLGQRVWVGERYDLRGSLISRMLQQAFLPTMIGLPVLVIILSLILSWGLKPLREFAYQLRSRPVNSLHPLMSEMLPSELEPMRLALNRQMEILQGLLERERRFITNAAHELRTPLAILEIHARNARDAGCQEEREAALEHIQHGLARTTRITSQLLTIARLEPRDHISELVNLTALVREELAELAPLALKRNIELVLENCSDIHLNGDPTALVVMLQNLVGNALAFAPDNSEVCVRLSQSSYGSVLLEVLDQGPGVPEDNLEKLGERFYSSGNPVGAGLGLSIVEMICRKMKGHIQLSNRREGGFSAGVWLPGQD
ncbi:ATP-binding protein [Ectopseudomonas mendocina]|uniref:histidine kinase n=1 Tax=Ectopseudomonas mendocina TaxID=300 RepID=A0ABZ2RI75_ECTME